MLTGSSGRYPHNDGRHLKVVLDLYVYADESGTQPADELCLVGGHIGSPRQWGRFNTRWRSILASERVDAFHARDFFQHRNWQSAKSPYHGWTTARGDAFLGRLVEAIGVTRIFPLACAVPHAQFDAQSEAVRQLVTGGRGLLRVSSEGFRTTLKGGAPTRAYQAAWYMLVVDAIAEAPPKALVHFVFDQQNEYAPFAVKLFAEFKDRWPSQYASQLGGIAYESSRDRPEIQVADLYCYLQARALVRPHAVTPAQFAALKVLNKRRPKGIKVLTTDLFDLILARLAERTRAELVRKVTAAADDE